KMRTQCQMAEGSLIRGHFSEFEQRIVFTNVILRKAEKKVSQKSAHDAQNSFPASNLSFRHELDKSAPWHLKMAPERCTAPITFRRVPAGSPTFSDQP